MSTTRVYKNLRTLTQIFTLVLIITNTILSGIFFFYTDFFKIEASLNLGAVTLESMYRYTMIINITQGFFAACVINSKVRFYMRVYLLVCFVFLCVLIGFIMFAKIAYNKIFVEQFSTRMNQDATARCLIRLLLRCTDYGENECSKIAEELAQKLIKIYLGFTVFSFLLDFVIFVFIRIGIEYEIKAPAPRLPKIERCAQVGFTSTSLRARRVINVNKEDKDGAGKNIQDAGTENVSVKSQ